MTPIFDRHGQVIVWQRHKSVCHLGGRDAAVINGNNVYGQNGKHLGLLGDG